MGPNLIRPVPDPSHRVFHPSRWHDNSLVFVDRRRCINTLRTEPRVFLFSSHMSVKCFAPNYLPAFSIQGEEMVRARRYVHERLDSLRRDDITRDRRSGQGRKRFGLIVDLCLPLQL